MRKLDTNMIVETDKGPKLSTECAPQYVWVFGTPPQAAEIHYQGVAYSLSEWEEFKANKRQLGDNEDYR